MPGKNFQNFAERINVLKEIGSEKNEKKLVQKRLQVKNKEMKMTSVDKVQFPSLNDKRYHFSGGIVSLSFDHRTISSLQDFKKSYLKIHTVIEKEKERLLKLENQIIAKKRKT